MKQSLAVLFLLFSFLPALTAQETDSLSAALDTTQSVAPADLYATENYLAIASYTSPLLVTQGKPVVYDVQQWHHHQGNIYVFIVLVLLLIIIAYLKVAFGKELEDMLQSFFNRNIAQQIFRTRTDELTFSSFLLHVNFILVISLYIRFVLVKFYHVSTLETFPAILLLIFLFTFFYAAKTFVMRIIGIVFEIKDVCDEYMFNFFTVTKTLGLSMIPALFVFYTAPEKFFNFIFIVTLVLLAAFALLFVWRGLSTGYKLMYKSVYHFFIYVCVVEISPVFLLFKLLTKTVV
ncbi:MAG: DUF4271 domain-containing protein [Chitinophagales bacterium]